MLRKSRILQILQNVDYSESPPQPPEINEPHQRIPPGKSEPQPHIFPDFSEPQQFSPPDNCESQQLILPNYSESQQLMPPYNNSESQQPISPGCNESLQLITSSDINAGSYILVQDDLPNIRASEVVQVVENEALHELATEELTNLQPGTYLLQEDSSLLFQEIKTDAVCFSGTASNIIIHNDRSLRKISLSSSTDSVSILRDEIPIYEYETAKEDKTSTDSVVLCPIEEQHNTVEHVTISSPQSSSNCQIAVTEQDSSTSQQPTRKRQKKSQPQDWSANKSKILREKGKSYLGKKKINGKWNFSEPKSERKMKDRCNCKLSLKGGTKLECNKILEQERKIGFEKFWNMSWDEKKMYIRMSAICKLKKRERCAGTSSRRENSVELYLFDSKGTRYRVCKKMFLNSLSVGEWVIKKWVIRYHEIPLNVTRNSAKDELHKQLRRFFDSLPKLESHYCRKNSSKLYLEPLWTSKSELYKTYKDDFCLREKVKPLSVATFSNVFEELNLSLFRPKKDLCDICESFKTGNTPECDYKIHLEKKEEARKELEKDTASNNEVFTMDLQSVLLSPRSNVSALYYKTKLTVHNFTLYDVKRNKGYCYIWNEAEGRLTSNEFSTIIVNALRKFVHQQSVDNSKEIILYSDGCTYQNRNVVLSNALLNFSMENKINIVQKYLEKGHTQMKCDSMHSVIERAIRHKKINVPADYVYLAKTACKKKPYDVEYLYHHFFKDVEKTLTFYKSIRPGKKSGDPTVTNLRALRYVPEGKIVYKLRHSNTVWEEFPIRIKKNCYIPWDNIPQLYSTRLKIKKDKYLHLQALKDTIEKDYHKFYDDLPYF